MAALLHLSGNKQDSLKTLPLVGNWGYRGTSRMSQNFGTKTKQLVRRLLTSHPWPAELVKKLAFSTVAASESGCSFETEQSHTNNKICSVSNK